MKNRNYQNRDMGICWSEPPEPPAKQRTISTVHPSAPPLVYNPNYTYAVKAQQQYPQQQYLQQQYPQQYYPPQQYQQQYIQQYPQQYVYQQQRQVGTGTAFVGGVVMGSILENMMDPE